MVQKFSFTKYENPSKGICTSVWIRLEIFLFWQYLWDRFYIQTICIDYIAMYEPLSYWGMYIIMTKLSRYKTFETKLYTYI